MRPRTFLGAFGGIAPGMATTMIDHLKQLSADTEHVILATCALARRAGGPPVVGSVPLGSAVDTREIAKELAAAKEELRAYAGKVAEWERKVASAEEGQKVAAESFKKGQRDIQMFKQQCTRLEGEAKADKTLREEAEKRATEVRQPPLFVYANQNVPYFPDVDVLWDVWCCRLRVAVGCARLQMLYARSSRARGPPCLAPSHVPRTISPWASLSRSCTPRMSSAVPLILHYAHTLRSPLSSSQPPRNI